jgi:ADP-heptose:LPS heptosyltransferase
MPGVRRQRGIPLTYRSHLYCYDPLDKSAVRSFFSPAKAKSCILPGTRKMRWFHRRIFRDVSVHDLGDRYVAEYFWHHTPVASSWPFRPPRLDLPPESWKPGGLGEEPFVLVNPTAGWRQKSWLPDRWVETLGILHDEANLSFVMTNASSDWQIRHCREIEEKTGRFVRSLAGGTTLENFLWLCSRARAVLTVDGSASHLAHAFGVPSVTLFGPTNSRNWHYPTPENLIVQAPPSKDGICRMRDLPVDAVIEAARTLLQ